MRAIMEWVCFLDSIRARLNRCISGYLPSRARLPYWIPGDLPTARYAARTDLARRFWIRRTVGEFDPFSVAPKNGVPGPAQLHALRRIFTEAFSGAAGRIFVVVVELEHFGLICTPRIDAALRVK